MANDGTSGIKKNFDEKSFAWPFYQAERANGVPNEEINQGCRVYNYKAERIVLGGREVWKGRNELREEGGDLTECEVLEYAFDHYQQYRDVIKAVTGYFAPWDWQGRMPEWIRLRLDAIKAERKGDASKIREDIDAFITSPVSSGGIGIKWGAADCPIEGDVQTATEQRCGFCTEHAWLTASFLEYLGIKFDFIHASVTPGVNLPSVLNHITAAHDVAQSAAKDKGKGIDWTHWYYQTRRQAFVTYLWDLGREQIRRGLSEEGRRAFKQARRIDPGDADVLASYAFEEFFLGKVESRRSMIILLRCAFFMNPEQPQTLAQLGVVLMTDNHEDEAKLLFERALRLNPASEPARMGLALLYRRQGKYTDLERAVLEANKKTAMLYTLLATALLRQQRHEEARDAVRKAIELSKDGEIPSSLRDIIEELQLNAEGERNGSKK